MSSGNYKEMFYAVEANDIELLRFHLRAGHDPNYQHPEVLSLPLVECARLGRVDMAKALLEAGADPRREAAWEGLDALATAEQHQHVEVVDLLRQHLGLPPRRRSWRERLRSGLSHGC